jgi:polar amino acid transport system substrate-binding protein
MEFHRARTARMARAAAPAMPKHRQAGATNQAGRWSHRMKNIRRLCVGLSLLLALLAVTATRQASAQRAGSAGTANEGEEAERRLVLRFLTEADFPPFNYYDDDGTLTGFNIDLARAICLEVNAACDIQVRAWEELLPALNRGEADAVIAAHAVSAKALAIVDFTDRYFHTPARFAGRRDGPKLEVTPEGLDGRRLGVTGGTAHEAYLRAFFRDSTIQAFDTSELAREALLAGKVDVVFDDGISLAFWVGGTSSRDCCELKGGPFHEAKFFGDGIAIAVPKSDPELKVLLNRSLRRIRASGRLEELVLRYFPNRVY